MDNEINKESNKGTGSAVGAVLAYLHDITYLLCVILLVFLMCFRVVIVSGSSMKNTLVDGDYLFLLSHNVYTNPQPGDIIVASKTGFDDGKPIVKRVIAVEGQTVDIDFDTSTVYVDGVALDESAYVSSPTEDSYGVTFPLVVDEGCVFVMGDNRMVSNDSRYAEVGLIDEREIFGKVVFLVFPGTDKGTAPRDFSRIGGLN